MKQKIFKCKNVLFLLLVVFFVCCANKQDVSAAARYRVIFANTNGVVSNDVFRNWSQIVDDGTTIQLPTVQKSGYRAYWVLKEGTSAKRYLPGASVVVKKNMKFCLSYYKLNNIRFLTANASKEYTSFRQQLCVGQYVTLPSVPNSANYKFLGWSTTKGGTSYKKAGTKVKVTGEMKFYAVLQRIYTVKLCKNDGTVYRTYLIPANKTVAFPAINMHSADNCLGWATSKGKSNQPDYFAGTTMPKRNATYYMVVYKKSQDNAPSVINTPTKHGKVYFVGDSRTVDAELALGNKKPQNVKFICKGMQGLAWFKTTGYQNLINDVRKQPVRKKKAVVINFGANDLYNTSSYITFMRQLAKTLKSYNCEMYFMSVNPVNSAVIRSHEDLVVRTESQVNAFNNQLYRALCTGSGKTYTYINTCHYLKKYGWVSDRWNRNIWDGLHYSPNTTLRIYDYCIRYLNR